MPVERTLDNQIIDETKKISDSKIKIYFKAVRGKRPTKIMDMQEYNNKVVRRFVNPRSDK